MRSPPGTPPSRTRSRPIYPTTCSHSGSIPRTAARCCWAPKPWHRTSWPCPCPRPKSIRRGSPCWRTSSAMRGTDRPGRSPCDPAGGMSVSSWRRTCGRADMARPSACCWRSWRSNWRRCSAAWPGMDRDGRHCAAGGPDRGGGGRSGARRHACRHAALYLAELARALEPVLPHDHLELLIEDADGARMYRLGEHAGGAVWTDPSLVIGREDLIS